MATVTLAVATASTSNAQSYATGSFTPAEGDLLVVLVTSSATAATGSASTSSGITFSKVIEVAPRSDIYVADSLVPASPGSMTVTWDCTGDPATGAVVTVLRVAGMERTGLSAVRQSAKQDNGTSGNTPTVSLSSAALTANPLVGVVGIGGVNPAALTEPSGWTERADTGYNSPVVGHEVASVNSGVTASSVAWGSTAGGDYGAAVAELDTSAADITVTPGVGALTLTGFAPTVTASDHKTVTPGVGQLTLTGFAPTVSVSDNQTVTPGVGALVLTGFAPTVSVTNNVTVTPGTGLLTLAGFAPTVTASDHQTVTPGVGQLTLTGFAPTILVGTTVNTQTGQLTLTGFAPTVTVSNNVTVTPGVGALVLTGFAPTVTASNHQTVTPSTGQLVLTGFAPTVTASNHQTVTPGVGQLTLTGFEPTVTVTALQLLPLYVVDRSASRYSLTDRSGSRWGVSDRSGSRYTITDRSNDGED